MSEGEKNGDYCSICGGIPPDRIMTKRILIDGKETGIDHLDFVIDEVKKLNLENNAVITDELLKRVKVFNYVPTKKSAEYGEALLCVFRKFVDLK
ncbi:MAG: NAC family transcription factor [Methanomicrobiales archaeon]